MTEYKPCPFCGHDTLDETIDQFICPVCGTSSDKQADREARIRQWNDWCDCVGKFGTGMFIRCLMAGINEPVGFDDVIHCLQNHMNSDRKHAVKALSHYINNPFIEAKVITDEQGCKVIVKTPIFWDVRDLPNEITLQNKIAPILCAMKPDRQYLACDIRTAIAAYGRRSYLANSNRVAFMIAKLNDHAGYELISSKKGTRGNMYLYTRHIRENRYPTHLNEVVE